jgi:hypothetical protein
MCYLCVTTGEKSCRCRQRVWQSSTEIGVARANEILKGVMNGMQETRCVTATFPAW